MEGNPEDKDRGKNSGSGVQKKNKCNVPKASSTQRVGAAKNTLRVQSCVGAVTKREEMIITSVIYAPGAAPTPVHAHCSQKWPQTCFHYSSVSREYPQHATVTCLPEAPTTSYGGLKTLQATTRWYAQHGGNGWRDTTARQWQRMCDADEYPPAQLIGAGQVANVNAAAHGQLVRYIPGSDNRGAGSAWQPPCFNSLTKKMSNQDIEDAIRRSQASRKTTTANDKIENKNGEIHVSKTYGEAVLKERPEFSFNSWGHNVSSGGDDVLSQNQCWPSGRAALDPKFALLTYDLAYSGQAPPYDYTLPYVQGVNGS